MTDFVPVTAADREAFADVKICGGWWRNMKAPNVAKFARDGLIDNNPLIQAFARHRIAAERSAEIDRLQRLVDAYRLQAVNEGWNHRMADAYGRTEYLRQRIAAVDISAQRTVASGYDATAYLRDGLAKAKQP